ncbi:hypothetical protein EV699_115119 [Plasticicumulans lactativorans]|uniref:O-antigen/teichoic acid export membrane protein n=1 Tax=Plasticicumulans lactativorans TaxID=1133106 RepID=A0A4R2L028_9GAMM|nr:hypothetical protein [Plasticicumulans lactativorans]TCO80341.1 hypothetical protein EV699_115119 [Plasticicumulans lactativorans]
MNALVQILILTSGLLMNFAYPLVFGLKSYGSFLQTVLLTLVCHRLIDIVAEPLIALIAEERFFVTSLAFNLVLGALAWTVAPLFGVGEVDLPLLFVMLSSSSVMLSLHRLRLLRALVGYLIVFNVSFIGLVLFQLYDSESGPGLRGILLITNSVGVVVGFVLLARVSTWRGGISHTLLGVMRTAAVQMPIALCSTLIFSFLTTIFPLLCSPILDASSLARLRVLISIAQASISAFPVNAKAIFVAMHSSGAAARLIPLLRVAFWYFFVAAAFVVVLARFRLEFEPYANVSGVMITFFWMVCLERYLLALGLRKRLMAMNAIGFVALCTVSFWVKDFQDALSVYAVSVGLYATLLIVVAQVGRSASIALMLIPAIVSIMVVGAVMQVFDLLLAVACLGGLAFVFFPLRRGDWEILTGRI